MGLTILPSQLHKVALAPLLAWLLGSLMFGGAIASSPVLGSQKLSLTPPQAEIIAALARANIIYLGENHQRTADRQAQLEIIQSLCERDGQLAIALEMFQRPYQPLLDDYIAGKIGEEELREKSEFERRWGFDWQSYAPILRFARERQLPLLALNVPSEITRQVAREGLESLTAAQRQWIPPLEEIRTDSPQYRQLLREIYHSHSRQGQGNSESFERFFTAQVLWDETMAETIVQFYRANPQRKIIVIAGEFHLIYGYGIPSRVQRRLPGQALRQHSVFLPETLPEARQGFPPPFDYFWPNPS